MPKFQPSAYVLHAEEGEHYLLTARRAPLWIKVCPETGSERLCAAVEDVAPCDAIPVHLHDEEDEVIFIHRGEGVEILGEEEHPVRAGDLVYIPRGTWHGTRNTSESQTLTVLAVFTPTGMEGFFRAIGAVPGAPSVEPSPEEWEQIESRFGCRGRPQPTSN